MYISYEKYSFGVMGNLRIQTVSMRILIEFQRQDMHICDAYMWKTLNTSREPKTVILGNQRQNIFLASGFGESSRRM